VIFAAVLAAAVVAAAATLLPGERWTGSATVRVEPGAALVGGSVRADDIAYLDRLINTYGSVVAEPQFAEDVARLADLPEPPTITHESVAGTNLMALRATTGSRADAMRAANAAAAQLVRDVRQAADDDVRTFQNAFDRRSAALEQSIAKAGKERETLLKLPGDAARERILELEEQVRAQRLSLEALRSGYESQRGSREARAQSVSVASPSTLPARPDNRNLKMAVAIAVALGLLAGLLLALVLENLAQRFRTRDEIEALIGIPVLSAIPQVPRLRRAGALAGTEVQEAFRRLRTALLLGAHGQGSRILLVTSAERGEGKSTVVANLARNLAVTGRSVLLIDADLRLPSMHTHFGLPDGPGVGDVLSGGPDGRRMSAESFIRPTGHPGLYLLPAGHGADDPGALLASESLGPMLRDLAKDFDLVIVDTPAMLAVTDALIVAPHVDEVLLVTGSRSHRDGLRLAHRELERAGVTPVGVVINRARDESVEGNNDYYQASNRTAGAAGREPAPADL